ncbi:MAG TPA: PQQ-binding-like beta-propeller repeat protein [Vicinamibacterales bacterium]|nr:PQQ-binding-like beta-propeller repeat protein [Vicinamibacterales bacterium]
MKRSLLSSALAAGVAAAGVALVVGATHVVTQVSGQGYMPSTKNGDWPYYTADAHGTKYSPLDQITAANFKDLEVAWRFKTDNLGTRPEYKLEGTPLAIKGVLYTTAGTRRSVVALDGKTGELIWSHSYREGNRAAIAPRQLSGRGVAYWTDGKGDERVIYVTTGYRLIELNAKNGSMVQSFGTGGVVDLKTGAVNGKGQQIDLETGEIGLHSTPLVVGNMVIIGSSFKEGMTVVTHNNTKGLVRAYDARNGKLLWTFNTIPRPGEFGNDTWENESWATNGNTGVWTQMTVDEEAGLVYLPVEDPTSDYYGGHRPGNNLYGDSLVAVDMKTGQKKWFFQIVHHPIWDYDLSSAPILLDATIDGKVRKLVALPSKESFLYVFDRITGQPIWPIEEKPVQQSDVPGEKTSPTQPFPTKPPAYGRPFLKVPDDLIDFTPALRAQALENLKHYRVAGMFNPPLVGDLNGIRGAINVGNASGGTNWPGAGADPENHMVYAQAAMAFVSGLSLRKPPPGFSDLNYVSGTEGTEFRVAEGPGFGSAADAPQPNRGGGGGGRGAAAAGRGGRGAEAGAGGAAAAGRGAFSNPMTEGLGGLPIVKPPYGVLSAIDLNNGTLKFQVPHGDTPDAVRDSPLLKGMNIPKTGQNGSVGLLVTKTLVVLGDPQVTAPPGRPRGAMLRAYNKETGAEVGAVWMPAAQSGSPMTYKGQDGRQYIVVAVSGGNYSGEFISFALPSTGDRSTAGQ